MRRLIVNDVCPNLGEYSVAVQQAEDAFRAGKDTALFEDTLEIACPLAPDCDLRFELYIKEANGTRSVRHGLIGINCVLSIARQQR